MVSTLVVAGFFLMLFLPCAVALLGSRHSDDLLIEYADCLVDGGTRSRERLAARVDELVVSSGNVNRISQQAEVLDPQVPGRFARAQNLRRFDLHEIEALQARAAALRANAEALDALARSAADRADAAADEAAEAESEVTRVLKNSRKAA